MHIFRTDKELITRYLVLKNYIDSLEPNDTIDVEMYEEYKNINTLIKIECNLYPNFKKLFKEMTEG